MAQILQNKNLATRFQILVEIAASQPNVQQKDIARKLDVTPQAISEYVMKLIEDGWVTSEGRSRYKVTAEGVDWMLKMLREMDDYFAFVRKSITNISVCTAVADCDLRKGETVGLAMREGLLFTSEYKGGNTKGIVTTDARKGNDVGISRIEGIVELKKGQITLLKVPGVEIGGSDNVDLALLRSEIKRQGVIGALGIEALIALRRVGVDPDYFYGVTEAAIEAAYSGLSFLIVCSDDSIPGLLKRLEYSHLCYSIIDLSSR